MLRLKPVSALGVDEVARLIDGAVADLATRRAALEDAVLDALEALETHEAIERSAAGLIDALGAADAAP